MYLTQKQKTVLRLVAKETIEPMNLQMVIDKAKTEYPRLNLTDNQARAVISCYQIGTNLFCGKGPRTFFH